MTTRRLKIVWGLKTYSLVMYPSCGCWTGKFGDVEVVQVPLGVIARVSVKLTDDDELLLESGLRKNIQEAVATLRSKLDRIRVEVDSIADNARLYAGEGGRPA